MRASLIGWIDRGMARNMTETKSERLGLRGLLALTDSALRLLGGANATGAIAAGAAFHALEKYGDAQRAVKWAAIAFLFGILSFVVGYVGWYVATLEIDMSLRKVDEPGPEEIFLISHKSVEDHRRHARGNFILMSFAGLCSFVCFILGLGIVINSVVAL